MNAQKIRWRGIAKPPIKPRGVLVRGSDGKTYIAHYTGGRFFGEWPGWVSITGWRRKDKDE